jgi:hypothetical protein
MKHFWPSVTQVMPPLLPSLQMIPIVGTSWPSQPFAWGHGVVMRGGVQTVVHAQAASFSLPQYCDDCTVSAGHSMAGLGGHSDSAHWRKLTVADAESSDQPQASGELPLHSTFGAFARDDGTEPHVAKLHSPLALSV